MCLDHKVTRVEMPSAKVNDKGELENPQVYFKHFERMIKLPFVIYADFEAILRHVQSCANTPSTSSTRVYQEHEAMSFAMMVKSTLPANHVGDINLSPYVYRGMDASSHFMHRLEQTAKDIDKFYRRNIEMLPLTKQQWKEHAKATLCYMCDQPFSTNNVKCRDHDHLTGLYRGAAHVRCNLNVKNPRIIPVFFHGLSGYDAHFIVRHLGDFEGDVKVIPNSQEKYITFSKKVGNIKLQYIDTYRFMAKSLDELAKLLPNDRKLTTAEFFPPELFHLVCRKNVFCYDYIDSWEKLDETQLPPKDAFYNKLNESHISDEDYAHAQEVWHRFGIQNLGQYSDHYLEVDLKLLVDVFENFRSLCLENYKLDPAHYFTLAGLAWDAALRITKIKLDLLTDYDMYLTIEKGIRGGIAQCCKRYSVANNPYLGNKKGKKYIMYFDQNNLYGLSMSQYLPTGEFTWLDPPELGPVEALEDHGEFGYILEVDVSYPPELHDMHNDVPLLAEHKTMSSGQRKLVTTLQDKKNYIVHFVCLKQALALGLQLTKVHRVIKFRQSPWLRNYIEFNNLLRRGASDDFEDRLYKDMNNIVYGKCMENVRARMRLELVVNQTKLEKLIAKPSFLDRTVYAENVVGVHLAKEKITFNKPIYVGLTVLDLSKVAMYDFYYNKLQPIYENKVKLLYMDTDSYIIEVETPDVYEDMLKHCDYYDTSNYDSQHKCFSLINHKVLGKMKDECKGVPIARFVGLRAKMYSFQVGGRDVKRAKGVKRTALAKKISFVHYKRCLKKHKTLMTQFRLIRSEKHRLYSMEQHKIALSAFDDKRYILPDGVHTLAHGHKDIPMETDE
ncbi:hypothetical protein B566_EDAN017511 [Ephemera danica]|nr:hypothetical protein B566_EDAN017511 [Ephemera danica]